MTVREHLIEAAKFDPAVAVELAGPPIDPLTRYAWGVFDTMHARRPLSAQAVQPLTFVEIEAYCRLTGESLTPLDLHLVCVIDDAYVAAIANAFSADGGQDAPPLEELPA